VIGCSDDLSHGTYKNKPPTVWIEAAPPEGSLSSYRIEISWGGWDPDGRIDHFEYCITNNNGSFDPADTTGTDKWEHTGKTSDVFVFSADQLVDSIADDQVEEFRRSHTFFIRSVDNEGLPSTSSAYRSFTAYTLSPSVDIISPKRRVFNPANVPPVSTFRWIARDFMDYGLAGQDPDSVSWLLESLSNHNDDWNDAIEWVRNLPVDDPAWNRDGGGWVWYGAPDDGGKSWMTPPVAYGNYLFAIRAKDEAGAITPVFDEARNMRRVLVTRRTTGSLLTLRNPFFGSVSTAVCNTPLTIVDLPGGVPVDFSWTADARDYGGIVVGYRYGWDIADLADPAQWEIDYTPFPPGNPARARLPQSRVYHYGTHVFTLEVMDNWGLCSRIEIKINFIQLPMTENLLMVDDFFEGEQAGWLNPAGRGILPSDEEHDQFWLDMLENLDGFDEEGDVFEVRTGDVIPLTRLADYRSIIWSVLGHVDQTRAYPVLYDLIAFTPKESYGGAGNKRQPNLIALFMAAGGHVMICGQHPVSMAINDTYTAGVRFPIMFRYEMDLRGAGQDRTPNIQFPDGDESFPYSELCLETMDFADTDQNRRRGQWLQCPIHNERTVPDNHTRDQTMRAGIPLDPVFPIIELRPETSDPGRWHEITNRGLDCEVYNPAYFFTPTVCRFTPRQPRDCFQPIYGLECLDTGEPTYGQPVAFYTSMFADRIAQAPGAIGARSVVFGFPPVLFNPDQIRPSIEHILFDEWQLPQK